MSEREGLAVEAVSDVKPFNARAIFDEIVSGKALEVGDAMVFGLFPASVNPDEIDEYFGLCKACDDSEYIPTGDEIALARFLDRFMNKHGGCELKIQ